MKLPYPMQLGSGTFDLLPGVAYLGEGENWAWMGEAKGTLRLGKNDNEYSLGNRLRLFAWVSRKLADQASVSAQIEGQFWGNIDGADPDLNPKMVPTADPNLRAGKRVDLFLALNLYSPEGRLEGNRLAIEGGFPLYEPSENASYVGRGVRVYGPGICRREENSHGGHQKAGTGHHSE